MVTETPQDFQCYYMRKKSGLSPITHFLISWVAANSVDLNRRERAVVTIAGIIPDLDGAGIVVENLTRHSQRPLTWFSDYHHVLGHNLGFGLIVGTAAFLLGSQKQGCRNGALSLVISGSATRHRAPCRAPRDRWRCFDPIARVGLPLSARFVARRALQ